MSHSDPARLTRILLVIAGVLLFFLAFWSTRLDAQTYLFPSCSTFPSDTCAVFMIRGTIVGAEVQDFTSPNPGGSPKERVCLLEIDPYYRGTDAEGANALVWLQGEEGVQACLDAGSHAGEQIAINGYLAFYEIDGQPMIATKPTEWSIF